MDILRQINFQDPRTLYIALTAPVVTYYTYRTLSHLLSPPLPPGTILHSPPKQDLSAQSPYPSDALPGAYDLVTPWGSVRTYTFGPASGRPVLFVHGISTPCIAFAGMAQLLAEREGCRVVLFDLWGRGYSDSPAGLAQDGRLFGSQILAVLSSAMMRDDGQQGRKWTVVGYSLGGGITMDFVSYFPQLVEGVVLVAPSGLLRRKRIGWGSWVLYSGMLPQGIVEWVVGRRLRGGGGPVKPREGREKIGVVKAAEGEVPDHDHPAHAGDSLAPLFSGRPGISPAHAVAWQLDAHPGFLPSFISSIQHAPISNQHMRWSIVGERLSTQRVSGDESEGLREGKLLVLLGESDGVVVADETEEDVKKVLGEENVDVVRLEGGHDLPFVNAERCVDAIVDFWEQGD